MRRIDRPKQRQGGWSRRETTRRMDGQADETTRRMVWAVDDKEEDGWTDQGNDGKDGQGRQ